MSVDGLLAHGTKWATHAMKTRGHIHGFLAGHMADGSLKVYMSIEGADADERAAEAAEARRVMLEAGCAFYVVISESAMWPKDGDRSEAEEVVVVVSCSAERAATKILRVVRAESGEVVDLADAGVEEGAVGTYTGLLGPVN